MLASTVRLKADWPSLADFVHGYSRLYYLLGGQASLSKPLLTEEKAKGSAHLDRPLLLPSLTGKPLKGFVFRLGF